MPNWTELLRTGVSRGASDISIGRQCALYDDGALERLDGQDEQVKRAICREFVADPRGCQRCQDLNLAYQHHEIGQFRVNVFQIYEALVRFSGYSVSAAATERIGR